LTDQDPDVRSAAARALAPMADVSSLAGSPKDPVRASLAAGAGVSLASSFARDALLPRVIRERDATALAALAKGGEAQGEAIAALGAMGTSDAISALSSLAAKGGSSDEAVRKAAFRALRRASRIKALREKHKEASS
jgi:HEAT repeat protein